MKKAMMIIILMTGIPAAASAAERDFWSIYGEHLVYNYAVKAGTGASFDFNHRLTSDETFSIATRSFSQSLGIRFSEIAYSRRGVLFVCIFSREPERCYLDVVLESTFSEIHFFKSPGFSQKFLMKVRKFYVGGMFDRSSLPARKHRARLVPPWKKFNPLFGFSPGDMELVMSTPFYTFYGIYVEPQYRTRNGPALGLMKDRWFVDISDENVTFGYRFPGMVDRKFTTTVTLRKGPEVRVSNTLISW